MAGCAALPPPYGSLQAKRFQVYPAALAVAAVTGLGELDALGAFEERRRKRRVLSDVAQKQFPAGAVAVFERLDLRHFLPLLVEHHRLRLFGAEERLRGRDRRLHETAMQPGDGRSQGAVDL